LKPLAACGTTMPEAVVFDLDYTLAVPERDRATLLSAAAEDVGAPPLERADYRRAHRAIDPGETREPIFERLLADRETTVDAATVAAAYRDHVAAAVAPVDGGEALVADLRERYVVGLLTDGPARAGRSKLRALGWTDLFDAVVVTGEVGAGKPDPRGFEAVCERLGVAPDGAVMVGDSTEHDVAGAAATGMAVVQVLADGGSDPDPRADATVRRDELAAELPALLESL
jgi:putative hydrolase of the HAD superfamily